MYWSQDDSPETATVPEDVVDLLFALDCKRLPVDHAYALSSALAAAVPWIAEEPGVAVHEVYVAASQNGWERPTHGTGSLLQLSRRTKLRVRVPAQRVEQLLADLPGIRLELEGCPLCIGPGKPQPLSRETTLLARHVVDDPASDEESFLAATASELRSMGIRVRKALCGRSAVLTAPGGGIHTRSLMLADLTQEESFRLQRLGLGPHRLMGCGVFIPHKGIDAVAKTR